MRGFNTGTLMFSLFSHINRSTSSAHDWVMNSQSEFDWLDYTDQRKNVNSNVNKRAIDKQNDSKWCDTSEKSNLTSLITETLYHSHSFLSLQSLNTFTPPIFSGIFSSAKKRNLLIGNKNHKKLAGFVIHSIHTTIKVLWGTYCVWNLSWMNYTSCCLSWSSVSRHLMLDRDESWQVNQIHCH